MNTFARSVLTAPKTLTIYALFGLLMLAATLLAFVDPVRGAHGRRSTVVLVHGAFADSSGWNDVAARLIEAGHPVVAIGNPLRGVASDASYVASAIDAIKGPVVLVGHSYGGFVISAAATGKRNVKALVYVAGFAPDLGENALALSQKFPGSTLGEALAPPVRLADGKSDLYIQQGKFAEQFAADIPARRAKLMAATQRPVTDVALNEAASTPAWKSIPSWFLYGDQDKNIPAAALDYMARRAGARKVVVIKGASHAVMISQPAALTKLIGEADTATSSSDPSVAER